MPPEEIFDITIVGGGPVGLYGLYYAGLRLMKTKLIDMLDRLGGGLQALYPEKYIYDVAGYPKVMAKDLVASLEYQAMQYPHDIFQGEKVEKLNRRDDGIIELTTGRAVHHSRTVVICAGLGAYIPKTLDRVELDHLAGRGVFYSVPRAEDFRGKQVLIVGGGDAAFDHALMLKQVASSVTLIHRNEFFNAHEATVAQVKDSSVEMKYPFWELESLEGEDWVKSGTIVNSRSGERIEMALDAVVLNIGFLTNLGPISDWGLELDKNAIRVDSRMRTNIDGVWAAGDIAGYDGKLKLIATGFGEVAVAVNNAKNYIDPRARVSPGHSTDRHVIALKKRAREERQEGE